MSNLIESDRIRHYTNGEPPPPVGIRVEVDLSATKEGTYKELRAVMNTISQQEPDHWPSDDVWKQLLPDWLIQSFSRHSLEEIIQNEELWTYGSWLDALKCRGWQWWSSKLLEDRLLIYLTAYQWPYSLGPIEYLVFCLGASINEATEI